jgi:hypothetical protein
MKYFFILVLALIFMAEGCRPPRCPLPNCYVRLKHRHGGENWKAAAAPSKINADDNVNANRGKVFRGVPWWKKNKDPKIGEGYKPGYKYDYKKPKPKKSRNKKSRGPEEVIPDTGEDTGEEQLTEGEEPQEDEVSEQTPEETAPVEEPKKRKGLFGKRDKKEKKQSKKEAEKPVLGEPKKENKPEVEKDGF